MNKLISTISNRLLELVEEREVLQKNLLSAARYALMSPGKRLRPLLTLYTAKSFGVDEKDALDPACIIEMIHTYSLIHDDLPAMDNDELRRGKPTVHIAFGEAEAILAGDFLLTYAFELLSSLSLPEKTRIRLIQSLTKRAGAFGMIGGQLVDHETNGRKVPEREVLFMHEHKTADLFTAALEFGAILGCAEPHDMELLQKFGKDFGLAYQIIDDILDETSTKERLGKNPGSDAKVEKFTSVSLYGIEKAKKKAQEYYLRAQSYLDKLTIHPELLRNFTTNLLSEDVYKGVFSAQE